MPDQAHGRLYVDGVAFDGDASNGGSVCASRSHTSTYTATRSGRLELALWDPLARSDDAGQVTVTVQRLTSIAHPAGRARRDAGRDHAVDPAQRDRHASAPPRRPAPSRR